MATMKLPISMTNHPLQQALTEDCCVALELENRGLPASRRRDDPATCDQNVTWKRHEMARFDATWQRQGRSSSSHLCTARGIKGVTLVELLITLAVLAISLTIAVPSFSSIMTRNKLATASNEVLLGIHVARNEAIRQNAAIRYCLNTSGGNWTVRTASGGSDIRVGTLNTQISMTQSNLDTSSVSGFACVRFRSDGLAYGAANSSLMTDGSLTFTINGNTRVVHIKTGAINVAES